MKLKLFAVCRYEVALPNADYFQLASDAIKRADELGPEFKVFEVDVEATILYQLR